MRGSRRSPVPEATGLRGASPAIHEIRPPLAVSSFGLTDRGKVRTANEDQFLIAVLLKALQVEQTSLPQPSIQHSGDRSYLFIVADGMGGRAGGETASALAIDSVETFVLKSLKWFSQCKGEEQDGVLADFQKAIRVASSRLRNEGADHPELSGMGTTLTLAYSLNDELFVAHVGDSRCYLCRGDSLCQLTRDHSLVEEMVRHGVLSAKQAAGHHLRHLVTNALGGGYSEVKVEVHKLKLESGDVVLLCSDGLSGMLSDDAISEVIRSGRDPEQICRQLVNGANDAGGKDNITVVVARFGASPMAERTV